MGYDNHGHALFSQLLSGLGITLALALISFAIAIVIGIIFGMFSR